MLGEGVPFAEYVDASWIFELLQVVEHVACEILHDGLGLEEVGAEVGVVGCGARGEAKECKLGDCHFGGGGRGCCGWPGGCGEKKGRKLG